MQAEPGQQRWRFGTTPPRPGFGCLFADAVGVENLSVPDVEPPTADYGAGADFAFVVFGQLELADYFQALRVRPDKPNLTPVAYHVEEPLGVCENRLAFVWQPQASAWGW